MPLTYSYNSKYTGYDVSYVGAFGGGELTVPSTYNGPSGLLPVVKVADAGFLNLGNLSGINLPNSLIEIGSTAFTFSIIGIGSNLTGLGDSFTGQNLKYIGDLAFASCGKLQIKSNEMFKNLTGIGSSAFGGYLGPTLPSTIEFNNDIRIVGTNGPFSSWNKINSLIFKKSLNVVGGYTFYNNSTLSYVSVSGGNLGYNAFWNCPNLREVYLGTGVTGILDNDTFRDCPNLSKINLENTNINRIKSAAFGNCSSLRTIVIPNTVTGLDSSVFYGCSFDSIYIGTGVRSIWSGTINSSYVDKLVFFGNYPTYNIETSPTYNLGFYSPSRINKVYRVGSATGWTNITGYAGAEVLILNSANQYNIALPYTGLGATDFKLLPADQSTYTVYETKSFSIGQEHEGFCSKQSYSALIGGAYNKFRQDNKNYPWEPSTIRSTAGSGTGIGSAVIGGTCNIVFGDYAVVVGGSRNCAYQLAGAILGGLDNEVGGNYNAVVNGNYNCINTGTSNSVILGGTDNIIDRDNIGVAILGGLSNRIARNSSRSLILGGAEQVIGGEEPNMFGTVNYACGLKGANACYSYIIGGYSNTIWSGNCYSTILGGSNNQINATKAEGKANAPSTGWSHIIVSQSSRVCSNLSFILGGDSAAIETGANRSFILGANATINSPYSFVLGGTDVTIPVGHECSAVISHAVNNKSITSRGPKTLLLNFDSGVHISNKLKIEGPLVLPYLVTPTRPDSPGEKGQFAIDEKYIYVCDKPNHWVRTALGEWEDKNAAPKDFEFYLTTYTGNAGYEEDVKQLGYNLGNLVTRYYPSVGRTVPTTFVYESGYFNNSASTNTRPLFTKNYNSVSLNLSGITWSINPPLSGGLVLNTGNGNITGLATGISFQTGIVYTVTASNDQGSTSRELGIWYYPLTDTSVALLENKQKQVTTYWVQGCGFGCGCQGGVGYYATTTVSFYVIDTTTLDDQANIRIRTYGVVAKNYQVSYNTGDGIYTGQLTFATRSYAPTIDYRVPYIDKNISIKLELFDVQTGNANNTIYTYYYNPVKAESNF